MALTRKRSKLPPAVALKHILKRCSSLGRRQQGYHDAASPEEQWPPLDVPKGHFVVYVGQNRTRHIVPLSILDLPEFQSLLRRAEEEFGFEHDKGLTLPCDDAVFQSLTSTLR